MAVTPRWRALTEADLLTRLSGRELASFRQVALGTGQADPVAPVLSQITEMVRGYIAACPRWRLGEVDENGLDTLPTKLIGTAVDLCVIEIMSRAAGVILDPNGVRKDAKEQAYRVLRDVAACAFALDIPDTISTEQIGAIPPTIKTPPCTQYGRENERGL